jgi:hypothetical protein
VGSHSVPVGRSGGRTFGRRRHAQGGPLLLDRPAIWIEKFAESVRKRSLTPRGVGRITMGRNPVRTWGQFTPRVSLQSLPAIACHSLTAQTASPATLAKSIQAFLPVKPIP